MSQLPLVDTFYNTSRRRAPFLSPLTAFGLVYQAIHSRKTAGDLWTVVGALASIVETLFIAIDSGKPFVCGDEL